MTELPFSLERTVWIRARRPLVFRHLVDPERFAGWWGAGSTVDARPGGRVVIRYPNGVSASGEVLEMVPGLRLVFSFGYDSGAPIPPGGSRVTLTLADHDGGTLVQLRHDVDSAATRDLHEAGWRHQLARFANVVSDEAHAAGGRAIDAWFAAWNEPDPAARRAALAAAVAGAVSFQDRFACTRGLDELLAHIDAARRHAPATLARDGAVAGCQGTALARWTATAPDGAPLGRGANVFELDADGRIARVVGLWDAM
jgi:uncharacterized protein YndB with AHSA1/START domain